MSGKLEIIKEQEVLGKQKDSKSIFNLSDVDVFEENGTLFFRIADVAKCIDYSSPDNWNRWFDNDEIAFRKIDGIDKPMKYMSESALYRVLTKSNVEKAKPFERWVTKDVIPSIRKTGSYSVSTFTSEDMMKALTQNITMLSNCVMVNNAQLQDHTARIEKLEKQFEQKKVEVAPDLPPKEHIIALVRKHADKTKETDYAKLYRQLYSDYGLRTHTNPTAKAKKSNMTTIAFIEKEGDIKLLLSIAEKLFGFGA